MAFNFGAAPFKYPPEAGFVALSQAPKDLVRSPDATPVKVVKDAPQAIILEVGYILFGDLTIFVILYLVFYA